MPPRPPALAGAGVVWADDGSTPAANAGAKTAPGKTGVSFRINGRMQQLDVAPNVILLIASHPSDMCVAMAAIGATIHVEGPNGRREIDFLDFHLLPGDSPEKEHALESDELITHVTLDVPIAGNRLHYLKLRDRASYQFALASCGAIVARDGDTVREARIAMDGVGTKPWRAHAAEQSLPRRVWFSRAIPWPRSSAFRRIA